MNQFKISTGHDWNAVASPTHHLGQWLQSHNISPKEPVRDPLTQKLASRLKILFASLQVGIYRYDQGGHLEMQGEQAGLWKVAIHKDDILAFIEGVKITVTTDVNEAPEDARVIEKPVEKPARPKKYATRPANLTPMVKISAAKLEKVKAEVKKIMKPTKKKKK